MNAVFRRYVHSSCRIINYSKHSPCISARVDAKYFSTEEKLDHVAQKAYDTKVRLKLAADAGISVGGFYNNLVYKGKKVRTYWIHLFELNMLQIFSFI